MSTSAFQRLRTTSMSSSHLTSSSSTGAPAASSQKPTVRRIRACRPGYPLTVRCARAMAVGSRRTTALRTSGTIVEWLSVFVPKISATVRERSRCA